ncbi:MAG: HEAT repeat domain-containing protein [Verrucomicrobiia bacterium]
MNRRISCLAVAIGVVFSLLWSPAWAESGNPGDVMEVVSIDLPNNQVIVSDAAGNNTTYTLTSLTAVTINGRRIKLSDLHPGMHVSLSVIRGGKTAGKIDTKRSSPAVGTEKKRKGKGKRKLAITASDLVGSSPSWNLLNDDQRLVVQSTVEQFHNLLDNRTFDGWSEWRRATLEQRLLNTLNGPKTASAAYYQAISALAAMHSTNALPALRELALSHQAENNRGRWLAVRALGIIGDPSVVPDMIHLLYHRNSDTRWWAQVSLVELTGQNFGEDWRAWGKWWNSQSGQPPFNPEIVPWWSDQAKSDKLGPSVEEADRRHLQTPSNQQPD